MRVCQINRINKTCFRLNSTGDRYSSSFDMFFGFIVFFLENAFYFGLEYRKTEQAEGAIRKRTKEIEVAALDERARWHAANF